MSIFFSEYLNLTLDLKSANSRGDYSVLAYDNKYYFKLIAGRRDSLTFSTYSKEVASQLIEDFKHYYLEIQHLNIKTPYSNGLYPIKISSTNNGIRNRYVLVEKQERIMCTNCFDMLSSKTFPKNDYLKIIDLTSSAINNILKFVGKTIGFDPVLNNFLQNGYYVDFFPSFIIPGYAFNQMSEIKNQDEYSKMKAKMIFEPIPLLLNYIINFSIFRLEIFDDIMSIVRRNLDKQTINLLLNFLTNDADANKLLSYINIRMIKRHPNITPVIKKPELLAGKIIQSLNI